MVAGVFDDTDWFVILPRRKNKHNEVVFSNNTIFRCGCIVGRYQMDGTHIMLGDFPKRGVDRFLMCLFFVTAFVHWYREEQLLCGSKSDWDCCRGTRSLSNTSFIFFSWHCVTTTTGLGMFVHANTQTRQRSNGRTNKKSCKQGKETYSSRC